MTFNTNNIKNNLDIFLHWEGIIGYTDYIYEFKDNNNIDDLEEWLNFEGIYGYTYKIIDILEGENVTCPDMEVLDFVGMVHHLHIS